MIAVLIAILLATLAGCAITRLLDRDLRGSALVGASILIGCGYAALMMFLLTVVHIPWSRTAILCTFWRARRRHRWELTFPLPNGNSKQLVKGLRD